MKQEFREINLRIYLAKRRLREAIHKLPEAADGVTMLGKNCCSVPFSLIGKLRSNLSPNFWLTHETKNQLLEMIKSNRSLENLITNIETILDTGKLRDGGHIPNNVLTALKQAWEG